MTEEEKKKIDLEINKLEVEISLTKEKLNTEQRVNQIEIYDRIKNWASVIITAIGVVGGIWGLFEGISKYHDIKRNDQIQNERELKFKYDGDKMASLVQQLDYDSTSDKALMLLEYYFGKDVIPILMFQLEKENVKSNNSKEIIYAINSISNFSDNERPVILNLLSNYINSFFEKQCKERPDYMNQYGMSNYLALLTYLVTHNKDYRIFFSKDHLLIKDYINSIQDDRDSTRDLFLKKYYVFEKSTSE